jgi:hypothetical protein
MLATGVFMQLGPKLWPLSASFESLADGLRFFCDLSATFITARARWQVIILFFLSWLPNFSGSKPDAKQYFEVWSNLSALEAGSLAGSRLPSRQNCRASPNWDTPNFETCVSFIL